MAGCKKSRRAIFSASRSLALKIFLINYWYVVMFMTLTKIYSPVNGPMQVAGLMSTKSGSNLRKLVEFEYKLDESLGESPYHIAVIFTDRWDSAATSIGKDYNLPVITRDIDAFYREHGKPKADMEVRRKFDAATVKALKPYEVKVAAYAGYMSIATDVLISAFLGVNVHPSDLSVEENGNRIYTGDNAVMKALRDRNETIRASTHRVEPKVDGGKIFMISSPLTVDYGQDFSPDNITLLTYAADKNQSDLKKIGDWVIFPLTLACLAQGRYSEDAAGILHFDGNPIPSGLRLDAGLEKKIYESLTK